MGNHHIFYINGGSSYVRNSLTAIANIVAPKNIKTPTVFRSRLSTSAKSPLNIETQYVCPKPEENPRIIVKRMNCGCFFKTSFIL